MIKLRQRYTHVRIVYLFVIYVFNFRCFPYSLRDLHVYRRHTVDDNGVRHWSENAHDCSSGMEGNPPCSVWRWYWMYSRFAAALYLLRRCYSMVPVLFVRLHAKELTLEGRRVV